MAPATTASRCRFRRHHIIIHCDARKYRSCSADRVSMAYGSKGSDET